jgi:transcriptional regulator with XRE-family HTH domain
MRELAQRDTPYKLDFMANLLAALAGGSLTRAQRRAKELAKADYRLLFGLVQARRDRGLSQKDVADRLGVSQPAVAAFERQDSDPKLSTIRRYAHAVGVIVAHTVELDNGQLDAEPDWSAATYRRSQVATYPVEGTRSAGLALAA